MERLDERLEVLEWRSGYRANTEQGACIRIVYGSKVLAVSTLTHRKQTHST